MPLKRRRVCLGRTNKAETLQERLRHYFMKKGIFTVIVVVVALGSRRTSMTVSYSISSCPFSFTSRGPTLNGKGDGCPCHNECGEAHGDREQEHGIESIFFNRSDRV